MNISASQILLRGIVEGFYGDPWDFNIRADLLKFCGEYDLNAYEYNLLYLETYNYMKNNNMLANKLFLADVTDLDLNSQVEKVKKIIDRR